MEFKTVKIENIPDGANIILGQTHFIKTVEDFKGKKLRGMGYYDSLAFQEIGAKGMSIPWTEAFLAVQRGVVDGLNCGIPSFESLGFWEYCKFFHTWPIHGTGCSAFAIMNGDLFDGLPPDIKSVVKKTFREAGDKISRDNCALVPVFQRKLFDILSLLHKLVI